MACGPAPDDVASPEEPKTPVEAPRTAAELAEVPPGTEPIQVEITWDGIGALYKGFFSSQEALTQLSLRLASHVKPPAQLRISWDQEHMLGGLRLVVPPGGFVQPPTIRDGALDLDALAPISVALAGYRDAVAGRYDIRVQSFVVGIDLYRGPAHCRVGIAGTPPPDGSELDVCLTLNGKMACGVRGPQGVRFQGKAADIVRRCFD